MRMYIKIFHFKKLLHSAGKTGVKEMKFKYSELKEFVRPVQQALNALPAILKVLRPRAVVCLLLNAYHICVVCCFLYAASLVTWQNNVIISTNGTVYRASCVWEIKVTNDWNVKSDNIYLMNRDCEMSQKSVIKCLMINRSINLNTFIYVAYKSAVHHYLNLSSMVIIPCLPLITSMLLFRPSFVCVSLCLMQGFIQALFRGGKTFSKLWKLLRIFGHFWWQTYLTKWYFINSWLTIAYKIQMLYFHNTCSVNTKISYLCSKKNFQILEACLRPANHGLCHRLFWGTFPDSQCILHIPYACYFSQT